MQTLNAINLVKSYKTRRVVDGITISLQTGKVIGLLGPNGAGKTTTFHIIAGLINPDAGQIYLNNQEVTGLPMHLRAKKGIIYLPQEPSVFKNLTVKENILIVLENRGIKGKLAEERANELLESMGLSKLSSQKGSSLSGGERRRLEVLRALATEPLFILLDEPFAGVDPFSISDLKKIINDIKKRNIGVFISDHNVRETLTVCDEAYIVNEGKVIAHGNSYEIAQNPTAREKYLGHDFVL